MDQVSAQFILGRREWIALPDLGLLAIKAKVDTGAKTSALHAHGIESFGSVSAPMVRFLVQPAPERPRLEVACEAPIIDRRVVTSSSGGTEARYIIATRIRIGAREWTIEIGLTNRESLTHRMLLGRQALRPGMLVDPASSYRQPRLSLRAYKKQL